MRIVYGKNYLDVLLRDQLFLGTNFSTDSFVTGVKKLIRLPSGSLNNKDYYPKA